MPPKANTKARKSTHRKQPKRGAKEEIEEKAPEVEAEGVEEPVAPSEQSSLATDPGPSASEVASQGLV